MNLWNIKKVAYVEDQTGMRQAVCSFLNANTDVKVVFDTDSGHELIAYLQQAIPFPNLCILDISMPKMDGLTLLKEIRTRWSKLPCLIYSMHGNQRTISKAIDLGANGYLTKQYGYDELYKAVVEVMEAGVAYTNDADKIMFEKVRTGLIEVPRFSDRERLFIQYAAGTGLSYNKIAAIMEITNKTVENYREKCFRKLKVTTRTELALEALRLGIINI